MTIINCSIYPVKESNYRNRDGSNINYRSVTFLAEFEPRRYLINTKSHNGTKTFEIPLPWSYIGGHCSISPSYGDPKKITVHMGQGLWFISHKKKKAGDQVVCPAPLGSVTSYGQFCINPNDNPPEWVDMPTLIGAQLTTVLETTYPLYSGYLEYFEESIAYNSLWEHLMDGDVGYTAKDIEALYKKLEELDEFPADIKLSRLRHNFAPFEKIEI